MREDGRRHDWQRTVLGVLLFAGSAAAGLTPVADGDLFWHLAAGREMLRTHAVLGSDPFSVSAAGRPWIDVHWLFQLAVHAVDRLGGLTGLVLVKSLLIGAGALMLLASVRRAARPLLLPILIGALVSARHLLLVRPVILSLLFLALFFLLLERFRRQPRAVLLAPLPLAQIVWSNCQGLFALGPALVAAYAIGAAVEAGFNRRSGARSAPRQLRPLLVALGSCLLGSALTPYGVSALSLPLKLLTRLAPIGGNPYQDVAENVPPFLLERIEPGQFWHLKWFLGLLALGFAVSAGRLVISHVLIVAGFVALALIANRNVLLLYWMAAPIAAIQLAPAARRATIALRRYRARVIARWLGWVVVAGLLGVAGLAAARESSLAEPSPFRFPIESARIIGASPGTGAIFSADHQAGYLIWKLHPRFKPYIDTRLVLRTPEEFREYLALAENPQQFDAFQRRHRFSYVVLPVVYPDRYLGLIVHLYANKEWKLMFTDGAEVLFARRDLAGGQAWDLGAAATTDRVLRSAARRFGGSPRLLDAARIQLATLDIAVGELGQAERVLSETSAPAALSLRARARIAAGDLHGAERIAERLIAQEGGEVQHLDLMAMIDMRRGRPRAAVGWLRRALAIAPLDGEATRLLSAVEEQRDGP